MPKDKYTATWVSHTAINNFLNCPRAYFLNHVYRDPKTRHKIQLMSPPLALGQAVHEVIESLSVLPAKDRFLESLMIKFDRAWKKITGKKGGFASVEQEKQYKSRGKEMLERVTKNPGPLKNLAVKIQQDLPYYWISEDDNIILCGKIDWLEYLPDSDSVHIIDFKTSKREEDSASLQLPIYHLLVHHCQNRTVEKASYWYLGFNDTLTEKALPDLTKAHEDILKIAKEIKLARSLDRFKCPQGNGCRYCRSTESILQGNAELVGVDEFNRDIYIMKGVKNKKRADSVIL